MQWERTNEEGQIYMRSNTGAKGEGMREQRQMNRQERGLHLDLAPQDGEEDDAGGPEHLEGPDGQLGVLPQGRLVSRRAGRERRSEEAVDRVERDAEEVVEEKRWGGSEAALIERGHWGSRFRCGGQPGTHAESRDTGP